MNSDQLFTVDPSLQPRGYDVHNPFGLFGATQSSHQDEADMDALVSGLEVPEDSPPTEEQEVATGRRSTSADSNATATPSHDHDSNLQVDMDDHDEERDTSTSDHENHDDDDKAQKPTTANNFVRKLHQMISDPKAADFIWWTELGTRHVVEFCTNPVRLTYRSFVVSSAGEFSRSILGQHFKHNNVCGSRVIDLRVRTNLGSVF